MAVRGKKGHVRGTLCVKTDSKILCYVCLIVWSRWDCHRVEVTNPDGKHCSFCKPTTILQRSASSFNILDFLWLPGIFCIPFWLCEGLVLSCMSCHVMSCQLTYSGLSLPIAWRPVVLVMVRWYVWWRWLTVVLCEGISAYWGSLVPESVTECWCDEIHLTEPVCGCMFCQWVFVCLWEKGLMGANRMCIGVVWQIISCESSNQAGVEVFKSYIQTIW